MAILEKKERFYYNRSTLFSENHPISKEDYTTRYYYFVLLHRLSEKNQDLSPYLNPMMKVYQNRFRIRDEDYIKVTAVKNNETIVDLIREFKLIRKNYDPFTHRRTDKNNYKYLFIAHVLMFDEDMNRTLQSPFFNDVKDSLRIKEDLLEEIICFVKKINENKIEEAEEMLNQKELRELAYFCDEIRANDEESQKNSPEVLVMATMSAGKSTFINSILGDDLLPSKNEACTAKVVTLKNRINLPFYIGYKDGITKSFASFINHKQLVKWNSEDEDIQIYLEGPFSTYFPDNTFVTLVDTPGPNNSMDKQHSDVALQRLEENHQHIFYLLNAANLATDDDRGLLIQILKRVPEDRWDKDLTFIINRMDEIDLEKDESIVGVFNNVLAYLTSLGIKKPRIIPFSSRAAKLLQMTLEGKKLSRKEKHDTNNYLEIYLDEKYSLVGPSRFGHISEADNVFIEKALKSRGELDSNLKIALWNTGFFAVIQSLKEIANANNQKGKGEYI